MRLATQTAVNVGDEQHRDIDVTRLEPTFLREAWAGLEQEQKALSAKYFYDERGSQYFDDICALGEYYPYRTEMSMLPNVADELAQMSEDSLTVVEFGAGSLIKIRPLLRAVPSICTYVPIDVSGEHLYQATRALRHEFSDVRIKPHVADMWEPGELPPTKHQLMGFFPGSTIGNFDPVDAVAFLKRVKSYLGSGSQLLIGVDTKKSPAILHRAYNDGRGITAAFNLNMLRRLNNELEADINLKQFEHYAYYNAPLGRIEMHLVSTCDQNFSVGGRRFYMHTGESIHTENSYKYSPKQFRHLAANAGWACQRQWLADGDMFAMYLLSAER
ncbi:L-histidine N(alpha)-methyltransferase [Agaribacterium haliotis]|uniref:L-histidine N(alpha)-methyltransferase n=1 Tax=Agaribacterium haliotis TaxID=2013869 RepID=UPI000BB59507|nr:L-histidine N(alpha)-methyltransferase [Agaribacterium haliotis]